MDAQKITAQELKSALKSRALPGKVVPKPALTTHIKSSNWFRFMTLINLTSGQLEQVVIIMRWGV